MEEIAIAANDWITNWKENEHVLEEKMRAIIDKYESEQFFSLYFDQPHEVRARKAARLYPQEQGYMLWVDLKMTA